MTWIILLGGLVFLALGGEMLVRGASALAVRLGMSALVVGVTVVAMGTSAPEGVVSILASMEGKPDIAVGNVVGSNIFNILFALAICALVRPLIVAQELIRRDVPIMVALSAAMWLAALDGRISRIEGAVFAASLVGVIWLALKTSREEEPEVVEEYARAQPVVRSGWVVPTILVISGLGVLLLGARAVVMSAVEISGRLGINDTIVSLTIVAAGTSLPEAATSVVATLRGQRDIAIGNVIGSSIFNIAGVAGLSALSARGGLLVADQLTRLDIPVMIAVAAICVPLMISGYVVQRWEGALLFAGYIAYTFVLVLVAMAADPSRLFPHSMVTAAVPPAALLIALVVWLSNRRKIKAAAPATRP
jgi:cation:H+ antiporter